MESEELTRNRLKSMGTMLYTIADRGVDYTPSTWGDLIVWKVQDFLMVTGKFPKRLLAGKKTYESILKSVDKASGGHLKPDLESDHFIYQGIIIERYDKEEKALYCLW